MKFRYVDFDNLHYAANLVQTEMFLKWNAKGNTHCLVMRGPYGDNLKMGKEEMAALEKLSTDKLLSGTEHQLTEGRFITFTPKGYVNNHRVIVAPATYAVFCCVYDAASDDCKLYLPNDACLYQCNVSAVINVSITMQLVKTKWRVKKQERQRYAVVIPSIPGYTDGSLCYSFEGCNYQYPVTKEMLGKPFLVPSFLDKPPVIQAASGNGYQIYIPNGKGVL